MSAYRAAEHRFHALRTGGELDEDAVRASPALESARAALLASVIDFTNVVRFSYIAALHESPSVFGQILAWTAMRMLSLFLCC